jgi:cysteine desulfurase
MQTEMCSIDECGRVNLKYLENSIKRYKGESILVSIHMANNEIGTIQDIRSISRLVHAYNGILHVDATQAFGHIPIDVNDLGIDMMSASGHKLSPVLRGIGFLYKKNGININPIIYGTQENGLRGGTENTYGIIGLNKAVEYCDVGAKNRSMMSVRDYFIGSLELKFGCKLNGHSTYRLPNNINVTFPQNITGENLLYMLDMSGIKISTGSACNSNSIEPSHVLEAIGLSDDEAMRTIRISLPYDITYDDVDKIISEIDKAIKIIES